MMAFRLARSTPPMDKMVWVTVGSASGMAAIASETALTNSASHAWPRARPSANITIIVSPAAAAIHRVSRLSSLVRGDSSWAVAASMPEILPSSVPAPVAVTITVALPCVTGVFMNAMFVCSPGPSWSPDSVSASLAAGTLSPVSADSSICSALASTMRPSAGTWSPAEMSTTSPTTSSSAGICASRPRSAGSAPRSVPPHPGGRLHHRFEGVHGAFRLALLPHPDHRVQHRQQYQQNRGAPLLDQQGHHRGGDQDDLHVAAVLPEEPAPARPGLLLRQRVRTVLGQQIRRLRG